MQLAYSTAHHNKADRQVAQLVAAVKAETFVGFAVVVDVVKANRSRPEMAKVEEFGQVLRSNHLYRQCWMDR